MTLKILSQSPEVLIGLSPSDPRIQEMLRGYGLENDEGFGWYSCHLEHGFETDFRGETRESSTLDTLFLYISVEAALDASDGDEFSAFKEPLPYGIEKKFGESDIVKLMGEPEWERKEIQNEIAGFIAGAYRYEVAPGKMLKVEFKNRSIYRLVLHKARD